MKKIILAAFGLALATGAYAQIDVVKAAERAMKDGSDAAQVVELITPAMTNPETATLAQTWYVPGKASYGEYDRLLGFKQLNRLPENGDQKMAGLLVDGFNYFMKAFPLDSVTNNKGKIKTKYSKDMANIIAGHANDYLNMGISMYNDHNDYEAAYNLWSVYTQLPSVRALANKLPAQTDTAYGEIAFNQALAAWQLNRYDDALNAFLHAKSLNYKKKNLYDYAIAVAQQAGKNDTLLALAEEALPMYGAEDNMYMGQIINHYLQARDFDNAFRIINQAIADNPNNAQYYVIQGVLYENNDNKEAATAAYEHAMQLDSQNVQALFNYGRMLCDKAFTAADAAPTTDAEYVPYAEANIYPYFRQAAEILEQAYSINPEGNEVMDILNYLENIYYNLNDAEKLQNTKDRKLL